MAAGIGLPWDASLALWLSRSLSLRPCLLGTARTHLRHPALASRRLEKEKDTQLEREMESRWKGTGASSAAGGGGDTPRNEEERKREAAKAWAKQKAKEEKKAKEEQAALEREAEKAAAESKARKEAKEKAEKETAKAAAKAKAETEAKEKAEAAAKAKAEAEALAKAAAEAKEKVEAEAAAKAAAKAEKERKKAEEAQAKKEAEEAEAKTQQAEEAERASKLKAAANAARMVEKAKPPRPYMEELGRNHTDEMKLEVATLDGVDGLNTSPDAARPPAEAEVEPETDEFGAPVEEEEEKRAGTRMRNLGKMKATAAPPPPPPAQAPLSPDEPGPSGAGEEDGGFRMYNDGERMMEEAEGEGEGEGEGEYDEDDPDAAMEAAAHLARMEQAAALQAAADSAAAQAAALMEASEQAQLQANEVAGLASPRNPLNGSAGRPGSASAARRAVDASLRHVPAACTTDLRRLGGKLPNPDDLESGQTLLLGEDSEEAGGALGGGGGGGGGDGAALDGNDGDDDLDDDDDREARKKEKKRKRKDKRRRKQAAAGLGKDGKKKGPGACATCCGLIVGNCWLIMLVMSILGTLAYDGFSTNEIDYWYPVRLCPRRADRVGAGTTFDQLSTLPLPETYACRAATNARGCYGAACFGECVGITDQARCTDCCGGVVGDQLQPCRFPFYFQRTWHSTCLAGGNDGSIHWCPTALGSDGRPLTTIREDDGSAVMLAGQCAAACRQADFVSAPATICGETACSDAGTTPRATPIEIRRDGFDGDAGFFVGAKYRLVLYAAADTLDASVTLRTSSGSQLYRGAFNRSACREAEEGARARRRLGGDSGGPGGDENEEEE